MRSLFISFLFITLPALSQACTVCFGGDDKDLANGFFWGILVLGALPFLLIGGFVGTMIYIGRKNKENA